MGGGVGGSVLTVVVGHVLKPRHEGCEALVVFGLAGGGDGGERAPVERIEGRDDDRLRRAPQARVLPSQLDGRLVRLRPRVAEEGSVEARAVDEATGELALLGYVIQVGHVMDLPHLRVHCLYQPLVRMAQTARRDASRKVEVLLTGGVPQVAALTVRDDEREAAVRFHHHLVLWRARRRQCGRRQQHRGRAER